MTFTITGSIRSKKNSKRIFATGRFKRVLPSKAYEQWERSAHQELLFQRRQLGLTDIPFDKSVHIKAAFFYAGNRPDIHGAMESLADCLQGIIIEDDRQIESWDGTRIYHDKKNPRVIFEIGDFIHAL